MIELTNISQSDFENYKTIFIDEETIELIEIFKHPSETVQDKAASEFNRYFPNGKTKENEDQPTFFY